tara:strand:- start:14906 stop:15856 length:951 start_codon:yes stop_codon:yes gene_type:complete
LDINNSQKYDVVIAGQGAAAFAAGMYAARYQIRPVIIGETFGGETAIGGLIENYPGYPEIDGFDLMMKFREAVDKYEVPVLDDKVVGINKSSDGFMVTTLSGDEYFGSSVIIAVGRERRTLGLEHEEEWTGMGVSYCSVCDAPMHRGNKVAVVGGGDSAIKGATLLSKYADQVYLIYRKESFTRPEPVNLRHLNESSNIEKIFSTNVIELKGENGLESIVLDREYDGKSELEVDGIFVEIGADPRVDLARQLNVELNDIDEIIVDKTGRTNIEGVLAAGDITDASGDLKQTITAAAQGALAATAAYEWVGSLGHQV